MGDVFQQSAVPPAPLVTAASILVPVGPLDISTTAIAIANPSQGTGGVNLILTNAAGDVVLNTVFTLGPNGQFARFMNELFSTPPGEFSTPLLLTMSAQIPVAATAFNFRAADFTPLPL